MPLDLTTPQPLKAAIDAVSAKTPVGAALRSKGWEQLVGHGLAEQGFFSAGVESVRVLQELKGGIGDILGEVRSAKHGGYEMDRGKLIRDIQQRANALGLRAADPMKRGTVQDFGSERRVKLILEQQIGAAQAKAFWDQGNDPEILAAFPALRLIRVRSSKVKRDWDKRWSDAAAAVNYEGVAQRPTSNVQRPTSNGGSGDFVALKSSPIWAALSRFKRPFPPFDFNSGMGVEEVSWEEAQAMGLVQPGETVKSGESAWKQSLEASVKSFDAEGIAMLREIFGEQVTVRDGMATFVPGPLPDVALDGTEGANRTDRT